MDHLSEDEKMGVDQQMDLDTYPIHETEYEHLQCSSTQMTPEHAETGSSQDQNENSVLENSFLPDDESSRSSTMVMESSFGKDASFSSGKVSSTTNKRNMSVSDSEPNSRFEKLKVTISDIAQKQVECSEASIRP